MPSPFPGMDPYLEAPTIWPDVHLNLISATQEALNSSLRPRCVARVELRAYLSDDDDPGRARPSCRTVAWKSLRDERGRRSGKRNPCLSSPSR